MIHGIFLIFSLLVMQLKEYIDDTEDFINIKLVRRVIQLSVSM